MKYIYLEALTLRYTNLNLREKYYMKKCSKCKIDKEMKEFSFRKDTQKYRDQCKKCVAENKLQWQRNNKNIVANSNKKWRNDNLQKSKAIIKNWEESNKEARLEYKRQYYKDNKEKIFKRHRIYERKKYASDINYKLSRNLRTRIRGAIAGKVPLSAIKELGCTIEYLKYYLEQLFQPDMTWDNYGKWHIDHIKPLSKFDLMDYDQFKNACHYTNLQPLWAKDNLSKGNR